MDMKYGEDVVKLFQYYIDNNLKPTGETRVGVVMDDKVIAVHASLYGAMYDIEYKEKKCTFICFYPLTKQYPTNVRLNPPI